jgi:hypothetical protein
MQNRTPVHILYKYLFWRGGRGNFGYIGGQGQLRQFKTPPIQIIVNS